MNLMSLNADLMGALGESFGDCLLGYVNELKASALASANI